MNIQIVTAGGEGSTSLASFDCALQNAGVSNYNLIPLSSVIPPNSTVEVVEKYVTPEEDFGKRLYVVKAEQRSERVGECIGAGIGWYQLEDGRGFFVEHETHGSDVMEVENSLRHMIRSSLEDMLRFRDLEFEIEKINMQLSVGVSKSKYASVLSIAVYKQVEW